MSSSCYIAFIISFLMSVESLSSPDMDNFDTRENFLNCTSPLMSEEYNDLSNCYTTWPIQFSLLITEKYCIKIREKIRQLSPMNIISCLNPNGTVLNCRNSKAFYNDTEKTLLTVNQTIEYFNKNGTQFLDENPYVIIEGDTPSVSDYFPSCKNYERSINITVEDDYTLIKDTVDNFAEIRTILFNEGPILAFMDTDLEINMEYTGDAIFTPGKYTSQHSGVKFFRVMGWRTINNKTYWLFSYTLLDTWGMYGYRLIQQGTYDLTFIHLRLK